MRVLFIYINESYKERENVVSEFILKKETNLKQINWYDVCLYVCMYGYYIQLILLLLLLLLLYKSKKIIFKKSQMWVLLLLLLLLNKLMWMNGDAREWASEVTLVLLY